MQYPHILLLLPSIAGSASAVVAAPVRGRPQLAAARPEQLLQPVPVDRVQVAVRSRHRHGVQVLGEHRAADVGLELLDLVGHRQNPRALG